MAAAPAGKMKAWVVVVVLLVLGLMGAAIFFVIWRRKKETRDNEYADGASLVDENGAYNMDDSVRTTAAAATDANTEVEWASQC